MQKASQTYFFDEFQLDIKRGRLLRGLDEIKLRPQSFAVLKYLVANSDQLISKDDLIRAVWSEPSVSDDSLTQCLKDIRHALGDEAQQIIKTVPKRGYIFAREVSELPLASQASDGADSGTVNLTFEEWMRGRGQIITRVLFVCVLLTLVISIALSLKGVTEAKAFASLAQFVVILIAFAHCLRLRRPRGFGIIKQDREGDIKRAGYEDFEDFERDKESPRRALAQYTKYWQWLLLSWVVLYAFLAFSGFKHWDVDSLIVDQDQGSQSLGLMLSIFNALFNNLNTLLLVLCFNVLNKNVQDEKEHRNVMEAPLTGLVVVVLAVTMFAFLFVAPIDKRLIANGASLVSGIAGGIAMALYVGRLQSKFLGPRPWLLIALYSYTSIQPLFVYLGKETVWTVLLIDLALVLKCLLYLYIAWLLQSGLLLFYFARMKRTYRAVRTQRRVFRELLEEER
ncbi:MAG: transcriptional regulator [Acidobacteriota bacterium]|nr:transcriptional regulator [Acidobacteriota bacterium]